MIFKFFSSVRFLHNKMEQKMTRSQAELIEAKQQRIKPISHRTHIKI